MSCLNQEQRDSFAVEIMAAQDKLRSESVRRVLLALAYSLNGEDPGALVALDDQMYREEKSAHGT